MPRAGLGGGWTRGPADQTARRYNLQPLSLDWKGAGGSPSISPPGGCSLLTGLLGGPWASRLESTFLSLPRSPVIVLFCCILTLLLGGVASTPLLPSLSALPGWVASTQSLEAGPGPALISHVSCVKRGESGTPDVQLPLCSGQQPSVSPCASRPPGAK